MEQENLYRPPSSDLHSNHNENLNLELASRGQRLGASILDSIILGLAGLTLFFIISTIEFDIDFFLSIQTINEYALVAIFLVLYIALYIAVNGYFLLNSGQTVGKKILGISIVNDQGAIPDAFHILGLRFISIILIGLIPFIGSFFGFIDVLFIFGAEKKCLHDYLAKTKVVDNQLILSDYDNSTQNTEKSSIVISDEEINASGIKYSEYSRQDLLETLNAIDHDEFPERVKLIELALKRFEQRAR